MTKRELERIALQKYHARQRFNEALASPPCCGDRHRNLRWVSEAGIRAGFTPAQVTDALMGKWGFPESRRREVETDVIAAARRLDVGCTLDAQARQAYAHRKQIEADAARVHKGLVGRLIAAGGNGLPDEVGDLVLISALSPFPVSGLSRQEQCRAFFEQLGLEDRLRFAGSKFAGSVIPGRIIAARPPEHVTANALDGRAIPKPDGKYMTRGDANVVDWSFTIIEFDGMFAESNGAKVPSAEQVSLVIGLLAEASSIGITPVSALYSGGKSIHVTLRTGCTSADEFRDFTAKLKGMFCSGKEERHRADAACFTASRLTRCPGGINAKTGRIQQLLWLQPIQGA